MRVFAISDIHLDYEANLNWLVNLSGSDFRDDLLILAGDVSDSLQLLQQCFSELVKRFRQVAFVPGNHDLWVARDREQRSSWDKFQLVQRMAQDHGVAVAPLRVESVSIVPLLAWYDYSFGQPSERLQEAWMDYRACVWPQGWDAAAITRRFLERNVLPARTAGDTVISFSHFLPRLDVMPSFVSPTRQLLQPIFGTTALDEQVRQLQPDFHVYGHSHLNRVVKIGGIVYINNAFGYPSETHISARQLKCIHQG